MKFNLKILLLAAACLLALTQILYSNAKKAELAEAAKRDAVTGASPDAPAAPAPDPSDVTAIVLSDALDNKRVVLEKRPSGWIVESLSGAPAEPARVARFLRALLDARAISAPGGGLAAGHATGTAPGEGIRVALGLNGGEPAPFAVIGLRPEESYDSVYIRRPDSDSVHIIAGDLRGDMGVWRNRADALPESSAWLETRVLSFDPRTVLALEAVYPDHRLAFAKDESGEWAPSSRVPGGEWSAEGLADWLADLSEFRVTGVAPSPNRAAHGLTAPTHTLTATFPDGKIKTVAVAPDRSGDDMWAETSDYPGLVFKLPAWRFRHYFQRTTSLFPKANPSFAAESIRFLDIRRGGESVKLSRRPEGWIAVATRYPLRTERVEKLARLLAEWRPLDYADAGGLTARPDFGGPLLEVTLEGGDVHQYRLGGRHPLFPWRYIQVDGAVLLAAKDADADVLFPEFADFLDLGDVFPDTDAARIDSLELSLAGNGDVLVSANLADAGDWEVKSPFGESVLSAREVAGLILAPLNWRIAGFGGRAQSARDSANLIKLTVAGGETDKTIVFLPWDGKEMPYLDDDGRVFLVGRAEFLAWLGVMRDVNQRLDMETKAKAEEARKAFEAAEAEAASQAIGAEPEEPVTEEPEPEEPMAEESIEEESIEEKPEPEEPMAEESIEEESIEEEPEPEEPVAEESIEEESIEEEPEPEEPVGEMLEEPAGQSPGEPVEEPMTEEFPIEVEEGAPVEAQSELAADEDVPEPEEEAVEAEAEEDEVAEPETADEPEDEKAA